MAAITICSDFGVPQNKVTVSPSIFHEVMGQVHSKGDQSWVFIGMTGAEAASPILWPHDANNWLIWRDPDVGKD